MKTVNAVAAVIRNEDKIFATTRGYGDFKGQWEFPGGKIEQGETPQQALAREIKEELDTEIEVGELIDTIEYDYPTFHLSMDCFWAQVVSGDLVLKEAEAAKWLTKETLDSVQWLPADLTLIEKIKEEMPSKFYSIVGPVIHTKYCACRLEIKWNVQAISDTDLANGFIVQHFKRTGIPENQIIADADYYEAWEVVDGKCNGNETYDDEYAIGYPSKATPFAQEEIADTLADTAGTSGEFHFEGSVYWISKDDELYRVVDKWPIGENKQAGDLRSVYHSEEFESREPLFNRDFHHRWIWQEDEMIPVLKETFEKAFPNNSVRMKNIEIRINALKVDDTVKDVLFEYFGIK